MTLLVTEPFTVHTRRPHGGRGSEEASGFEILQPQLLPAGLAHAPHIAYGLACYVRREQGSEGA